MGSGSLSDFKSRVSHLSQLVPDIRYRAISWLKKDMLSHLSENENKFNERWAIVTGAVADIESVCHSQAICKLLTDVLSDSAECQISTTAVGQATDALTVAYKTDEVEHLVPVIKTILFIDSLRYEDNSLENCVRNGSLPNWPSLWTVFTKRSGAVGTALAVIEDVLLRQQVIPVLWKQQWLQQFFVWELHRVAYSNAMPVYQATELMSLLMKFCRDNVLQDSLLQLWVTFLSSTPSRMDERHSLRPFDEQLQLKRSTLQQTSSRRLDNLMLQQCLIERSLTKRYLVMGSLLRRRDWNSDVHPLVYTALIWSIMESYVHTQDVQGGLIEVFLERIQPLSNGTLAKKPWMTSVLHATIAPLLVCMESVTGREHLDNEIGRALEAVMDAVQRVDEPSNVCLETYDQDLLDPLRACVLNGIFGDPDAFVRPSVLKPFTEEQWSMLLLVVFPRYLKVCVADGKFRKDFVKRCIKQCAQGLCSASAEHLLVPWTTTMIGLMRSEPKTVKALLEAIVETTSLYSHMVSISSVHKLILAATSDWRLRYTYRTKLLTTLQKVQHGSFYLRQRDVVMDSLKQEPGYPQEAVILAHCVDSLCKLDPERYGPLCLPTMTGAWVGSAPSTAVTYILTSLSRLCLQGIIDYQSTLSFAHTCTTRFLPTAHSSPSHQDLLCVKVYCRLLAEGACWFWESGNGKAVADCVSRLLKIGTPASEVDISGVAAVAASLAVLDDEQVYGSVFAEEEEEADSWKNSIQLRLQAEIDVWSAKAIDQIQERQESASRMAAIDAYANITYMRLRRESKLRGGSNRMMGLREQASRNHEADTAIRKLRHAMDGDRLRRIPGTRPYVAGVHLMCISATFVQNQVQDKGGKTARANLEASIRSAAADLAQLDLRILDFWPAFAYYDALSCAFQLWEPLVPKDEDVSGAWSNLFRSDDGIAHAVAMELGWAVTTNRKSESVTVVEQVHNIINMLADSSTPSETIGLSVCLARFSRWIGDGDVTTVLKIWNALAIQSELSHKQALVLCWVCRGILMRTLGAFSQVSERDMSPIKEVLQSLPGDNSSTLCRPISIGLWMSGSQQHAEHAFVLEAISEWYQKIGSVLPDKDGNIILPSTSDMANFCLGQLPQPANDPIVVAFKVRKSLLDGDIRTAEADVDAFLTAVKESTTEKAFAGYCALIGTHPFSLCITNTVGVRELLVDESSALFKATIDGVRFIINVLTDAEDISILGPVVWIAGSLLRDYDEVATASAYSVATAASKRPKNWNYLPKSGYCKVHRQFMESVSYASDPLFTNRLLQLFAQDTLEYPPIDWSPTVRSFMRTPSTEGSQAALQTFLTYHGLKRKDRSLNEAMRGTDKQMLTWVSNPVLKHTVISCQLLLDFGFAMRQPANWRHILIEKAPPSLQVMQSFAQGFESVPEGTKWLNDMIEHTGSALLRSICAAVPINDIKYMSAGYFTEAAIALMSVDISKLQMMNLLLASTLADDDRPLVSLKLALLTLCYAMACKTTAYFQKALAAVLTTMDPALDYNERLSARIVNVLLEVFSELSETPERSQLALQIVEHARLSSSSDTDGLYRRYICASLILALYGQVNLISSDIGMSEAISVHERLTRTLDSQHISQSPPAAVTLFAKEPGIRWEAYMMASMEQDDRGGKLAELYLETAGLEHLSPFRIQTSIDVYQTK
eukprot:Clim_evm7s250 gene=Clim_evmTU7s250